MPELTVLWWHNASERILCVAGGNGNQGDSEIQSVIDKANYEIGETLWLETLESASCLRLCLPLFSGKQLGQAVEYGP